MDKRVGRAKRAAIDVVESRQTQLAVVDRIKHGAERKRKPRRQLNVVSLSFSLTKDVDQVLDFLAVEDNVSRSHVVRQAVIYYGVARGVVAE